MKKKHTEKLGIKKHTENLCTITYGNVMRKNQMEKF